MNTLETSFLAIALSLCLICALLTRSFRSRISLRFFRLYLLLEAFGFTLEWLMAHPHSPYKALWLALFMDASLLMAPCLWLFAVETSEARPPSLRRLGLPEWGLILVGMFATAPLALTAHSGNLMVDPHHPATGFASRYIHETMLLAIALFTLQVPWYLGRCMRVVRLHEQRDPALFSNREQMPLVTLKVLLLVMLGNWLLALLRTVTEWVTDGAVYINLAYTCAEVVIMLIALYVIARRALVLAANPERAIELGPSDEDLEANKYAKSSLDDVIRQRIERKLQRALEEEHIYARSDLRLRDLCDHLNENTHYVSQVINETMGTSFYELINYHRVEYAKKLLASGERDNVLEVAMKVGFNSKTTFNAAFKRVTGMTPKAFKAGSCLSP